MRLVSWNVNGLRAALHKGFTDWLDADHADVICLQETKLQEHQIPDEVNPPPGCEAWWSFAEQAGYSGVALFSRVPVREVREGFGHSRYDAEGRTLVAEFDGFTLINGYFPNGGQGDDRLAFKLDYYRDLLAFVNGLRAKGRAVVITGDLNTSHMERDIARPDANRTKSGFMDIERAWLDTYMDNGLVDTFRMFEEGGGHYSWWSMRGGARKRNVGWRLDYFLVTQDLRDRVVSAEIHTTVMGSDHCPVSLELDL
ncbi:MAG: exodeoxyribonuclease III [Alphaproteobacteria bacterium]|nr:exodeoxyribonuclease III [Alphaproteobacteria bacterium]